MLVVFVSNLARPALTEADALAASIGTTVYDTRLALAAGPPSVLLTTRARDRAADVLAQVRARGHGAHIFDEENFVSSAAMTKMTDFLLESDGIRRQGTGELLPYGDIYAILRAVHEPGAEIEETEEREHVGYFFRRSGERPWLLRERHTSYVGLGADRGPVAFTNFTRTLTRVREAAAMAIFDDRLVHRRVGERAGADGQRSSRDGMDLLAHLLAMTIASQGGSPYR